MDGHFAALQLSSLKTMRHVGLLFPARILNIMNRNVCYLQGILVQILGDLSLDGIGALEMRQTEGVPPRQLGQTTRAGRIPDFALAVLQVQDVLRSHELAVLVFIRRLESAACKFVNGSE